MKRLNPVIIVLLALLGLPFGAYSHSTPELVEISFTITEVSCNGEADGSIDLIVIEGVPPYSYAWSNGATTEDIAGLTAGFYSVTVTDAEDMFAETGITLSQPAPMAISLSVVPITCSAVEDGAIFLTISGGTAPYTYAWSNGATTQSIAGLSPGDYSVTVTDINGCDETETAIVPLSPSPLTLTYIVQNADCEGLNGSIDITVSGGAPPYAYSWSTGNTLEDIDNLIPEIYQVTVTDSNGCDLSETIQVEGGNLVASVSNFSCDDNGTPGNLSDDLFSFELVVTGGTGSGWTSTSGLSGLYGEGFSFNGIPIQEAPLIATFIDNENPTCNETISVTPPFDACEVTCSILPTFVESSCDDNGTPGDFSDDLYSISLVIEGSNTSGNWIATDPNNTTGVFGQLTVFGPYLISDDFFVMEITDELNPDCTTIFTVAPPIDCFCQFNPMNIDITGNLEIPCEPGGSTTLTANVTGGVPPYAYLWSQGQSSPSIEVSLPGGTFYLTTTDSNGCEAIDTVVVTTASTIIADAGFDQVITCDEPIVTLDGSNSSSGANLTYTWTGPNNFTSPDLIITVNQPGTYELHIEEAGNEDCGISDFVTVTEDILGPIALTYNLVNCDSAQLFFTVAGLGFPSWAYPDGTEAYTNSIGTKQSGYHVLTFTNPDNGCVVVDSILVELDPSQCATIEGRLVLDTLLNCLPEVDEPGLSNWMMVIEGENNVFYAVSQADGSYTQRVPLGDYTLYPILISGLWESCEENYPVSLSTPGETVAQDLTVFEVEPCPELSVEVTLPILRRCWQRTIYVHYCNNGTALAEDAYVTVILDDLFTYQSSSLPIAMQDGNTFTFDLGQIDVNDCGNFYIWVITSCDAFVGESLCAEAKIFPNEPCFAPNAEWSGSSLQVTGECLGDEVLFRVENIGEDMVDASNFIVIEDGVMLMVIPDTVQLNAGETFDFPLPANGSTYRMEVDQVDLHPGMDHPTAIVEGCGTNEQGGISTGFVNQFPMNDEDEFIDIDCREIVASNDPNDKHGFPRGYGAEHYIKPGTGLEYLINFQNTGTDTAFLVVLRDTLSPYLDIRTVRPGAASHPYTWDIEGGNVLVFTFENILLPDSTTNEVASHGAIEYTIEQMEGLALETVIENSVAIYFDINEPVITNTTHHRLGESFIEIITTGTPVIPSTAKVSVFPNPMSQHTRFELEGWAGSDYTFKLNDTRGQLVYQEAFQQNVYSFAKRGLSAGLYFYQITNKRGESVQGKLFIK